MSDYAVADGEKGAHAKTLTPNSVDVVTFAESWDHVEVLSLDAIAPIYFTIDNSTPTVKGAHTFVVPAAIGERVVPALHHDGKVVKLISEAAVTYSVSRVDS